MDGFGIDNYGDIHDILIVCVGMDEEEISEILYY